MKIPFYKYQGTGNDFIIINQQVVSYFKDPDAEVIQRICDRRYGVGADGLILLEKSELSDFKMVYFNSDGHQSTMCGNGGRCIVHLAHSLKIFRTSTRFEAIDGLHEAKIITDQIIELKMKNVNQITEEMGGFVLDTGSPHLVIARESLEDLEVLKEGRALRYHPHFGEAGVNVNFIQLHKGKLAVRTYERGVENETLSCGTGVTAAAIVASQMYETLKGLQSIPISTNGGDLCVRFRNGPLGFTDIWLLGPAEQVFNGSWEI